MGDSNKERQDEYSTEIYYDFKGDLILVEKEFQRPLYEITICKCRYNNKGKLIEAIFDSESGYARYNGDKHYKY